jgi:WD40 repeat protein
VALEGAADCDRAAAQLETATREAGAGRPDQAADRLARLLLECPATDAARAGRRALIALLEREVATASAGGNLERVAFLRSVLARLDPGPGRSLALVDALLDGERRAAARTVLERLREGARPAERAAIARREQALARPGRAEADHRSGAVAASRDGERGLLELAAGRPGPAGSLLRSALRARPEPRWLLALGEVHRRLGQEREALRAFSRALGLAEERAGRWVVPEVDSSGCYLFSGRPAPGSAVAGPEDLLLPGNAWEQCAGKDEVTAVAIDPRGRHLAVAGDDGKVRLVPLEGGRLRVLVHLAPTPGSPGHRVEQVAFDPQGRYLATASRSGRVRLWALPGGEPLHTLTGSDPKSEVGGALAFDPRGGFLAWAYQGTLKRFALPSGQLLGSVPVPKGATEEGPVEPPRLSIDPLGRYLVLALDKSIHLWSLPALTLLRSTVAAGSVSAVTIDAQGQVLATGTSGTVQLWTLPTLAPLRTLKDHSGMVYALAFDPQQRYLAWAGFGGGIALGREHATIHQDSVRLWDPRSGEFLRTLTGHSDVVYALAQDPRGHALVSGATDGTVRVWAPTSGTLLATVVTRGDDWAVFTPEGHLDGSPQGRRFVRYRLGDEELPWQIGWARFGVSGLLGRVLAGEHDHALCWLRRL